MVPRPHRTPPLRCVRQSLPKAPRVCILAAAHQQPKHPCTYQATNRIISPMTTPPTLVQISPPHAILPPVTKGNDFNPKIRGWKKPRVRPTSRWADSIKHDFHSAGLDTTNAARMVFDRPQWKAFVSGLPSSNPSKALN